MCDALDMTEGQMKRQVKNIQNDMLLAASGSNQILNKGSGEREVFCIKLDYVPIWLAKISITQKTREERPEFAQKLLEYQLKAKDILAAAFLPKQESNGDVQGQIKLLAQGTTELYERVEALDKKLETALLELPLLGVESDKVDKALKNRGVEIAGGKESNSYKDKSLLRRIYWDLHGQLRREFGVSTYKAIKRNQADLALKFLAEYKPPLFLAEQIAMVNAQQTLDLGGGVQA